MKPLSFLPLALVISPPPAIAQNLVPNGSFEQHTECPDNLNQINRAAGWSAFRGSPDLLDECSPTALTGIPQSIIAYQLPATGNACAGLLSWCQEQFNTREVLGTELAEPLMPGAPVQISFKVVAGSGGTGENFRMTCSGLGVRFTMEPYWQGGGLPMPNSAVLTTNGPILDTLNWTLLTGEYVPDSAYRYVTLGNFFDDAFTNVVEINTAGNSNCAYLLVDDICITQSGETCEFIMASSLEVQRQLWAVYPNPAIGNCIVRMPQLGGVSRLDLFSDTGQIVANWTVDSGTQVMSLSLSGIAPGHYVLAPVSSAGRMIPVQLLILSP